MDTQQLIALGLVGLAAVYLGRGFIASARNLFATKSGCGGCGKCSFAQGGNDLTHKGTRHVQIEAVGQDSLRKG